MSPAIQLLQQVWDHCQEATGHSWLKLNHAMADTLALAIRAGMRFDPDDFGVIARHYRPGYWLQTEKAYSLAVLYRNASAYHAFEAHWERKPFIVKGASIHTHTGDGPCGQGLARLIVGAEFSWNGERVKVTSFHDGNDPYFVACSYRLEGEYQQCKECRRQIAYPESKLAKRYTITHADLRAAKKASLSTPTPTAEGGANG